MTVDPLTEKYYSYSPYAFCNNNPVNFVDPDGNHPVIAGAIIGGAISGTAAIIKGKSFTEVIAATTGGAVDGALAASGAKLVTKIALGATGSGLGDIAEQGINIICDNQESFDWGSSIVSTILGMASTGVTESIETGLKSVAESLISSRTTYQTVEKGIKTKNKSTGRIAKPSEITKSAKNEVDAMNDANSKIIATSVQTLDYTVEFYYDIFNEEEQ